MAQVLAAAAILVATASAVSLLMALPAVALAETAGEPNAAGRARVWLAAIVVPPLIGLCAAAWALALHARGLSASPHIGGQRPHLCVLPLSDAPSGAFTLRLLAWLALLLVVVAIVRLVATATSSHLLRRRGVASGISSRKCAAARVVEMDRPVSLTAGLLRPVTVIAGSLERALGGPELEAIVAHERAHARRRDNILRLLAEVCVTLIAPMPTAWYYRGRLHEAIEEAADDEALASGVSGEALQAALKASVEASSAHTHTPSLTALLIPPPAHPQRRAERLARREPADAAEQRGHGRRRAWIAAGIGMLLLAVLLLAARRAVEDSLYCAAEQLTHIVG